MEDRQIVDLFFERNEQALKLTEEKYSRYCSYVANNILGCEEDTKECLNDMLLKAWHSIPPTRPDNLKAYLAKIIRNLALDKYDHSHAQKRDNKDPLPFDELSECIPDGSSDSTMVDKIALKTALNGFLESLKEDKRIIFMQRYWYLSPVKEIALRFGVSENNIKVTLMRLRTKLKKYLEKEGVHI